MKKIFFTLMLILTSSLALSAPEIHVVSKSTLLNDADNGFELKVGDFIAVEMSVGEKAGSIAVLEDLFEEVEAGHMQTIPGFGSI